METFKHVISMGRDKIISGIKYVYSDINPSTLTGAIDVIVVEQVDGTFTCGPFHVRFGKMGTLKPADKIVDIHLNGKYLENLHMKLGSAGEAYFIETVEEAGLETIDSSLVVSPFHSDIEDVENVDNSDLSARISSKKRGRRYVRAKTEHFTNLEENSTNPEKRNYQCLSDNDDFAQDDNVERVQEGYNSDGAVDKMTEEKMHDINMTWDWGNFPLDNRNSNDKSKSEDVVDQLPGKSTLNEVYLEDIMAEDISEEFKRNYLYTEGIEKKPKISSAEMVTTMNIDAGYRSDGEGSITTMSPSHPVIYELKFSMCGNINLNDQINEELFYQYLISFDEFVRDPDEILKNSNLVVRLNGKYYNWSVAAPIILSILAFQTELPATTVSNLRNTYMCPKKKSRTAWFSWRRQEPSPVRKVEPVQEKIEPPKPNTNIGTPLLSTNANSVSDETELGTSHNRLYKKKIRLSSEEVASLNLLPGRNDIKFSMTTKYQGTTYCQAAIYRWNWYDKIVISDVDGTITKSDVLGHVLPILGRDWTQAGVAKLYRKICRNNYQFIYLSARAIGQAGITRTFLADIVQDSSMDRLPEGPILLSPTSLFQSLHREVIEKKPEYFKIQCLNDVRSLFPDDARPLYAGFGNRINDVIAYKEVGIDPKRIFTVNPEGSLKNEYCQKWSTSYGNLFDVADHFFQFQSACTTRNGRLDSQELQDFVDVNYWATPIDEVPIRDEISKSRPSSEK